MKKKFLLGLVVCATMLAGCGSRDGVYNGYGVKEMATDSYEASYAESYSTGGDYSTTSIEGDLVGYSYNFSANGKTNKTREEMLSYYEEVQGLVTENNGYIENVNNDYSSYMITPDQSWISDNEKYYKASGMLSFTVEIPNDSIKLVTDSLENFCKDNKFTVTRFNQSITNYKSVRVTEGGEDYSYNSITREELEKRVKYASLYVNISYYQPRGALAVFGYTLRQVVREISEVLLSLIMVLIVLLIAISVIFVYAKFLYKSWKKMVFKHKIKKPEYYGPKHIVIDETPKAPGQQ